MEFHLLEEKIKALTLAADIQPSSFPDGNSSCYYFPEEIKSEEQQERWQKERLNHVLHQFKKERDDTSFSRNCLFCKNHFTGNRAVLFAHLMDQHNFHIGSPDNIVFVRELFDVLEEMLRNLKCFYCEKIFKDWMTLKEHMRKKQHKQINPKNKTFDKFYIINYLELGKTWTEVQLEEEYSQESDDNEMEIAESQGENQSCLCLFCKTYYVPEEIFIHMKDVHHFDFNYLKKNYQLEFYKQVKLINYIRRQMLELKCTYCDCQCSLQDELLAHLVETGHISLLPDPSKWNEAMYYFSTFENDNLLCILDDDDDTESHESLVLPEDTTFSSSSVLQDENIRNMLL